ADANGRIDLLRKQGERIAGLSFTTGNTIQLLHDGPSTYLAMERLIAQASRRIDMESYLFDDVEGRRVTDLLLAKRAQGVEVHLIYDAWGSASTCCATRALWEGHRGVGSSQGWQRTTCSAVVPSCSRARPCAGSSRLRIILTCRSGTDRYSAGS